MSTTTKPRVVIVGIDYTETSQLALERSFELATAEPNVELHALHVVPPPASPYMVLGSESTAERQATLVEHVGKALEGFLATHASATAPARVICHVRVAEPAHELAQLAADLEADLLVVGTHGRRALTRLFLGSVAEVVVRLAPCPVLVVRPKAVPAPVPRIEPPCPRCVEARERSGGSQYWCEQHLERHGQRHTYHQGERISGDSSFPLMFKS